MKLTNVVTLELALIKNDGPYAIPSATGTIMVGKCIISADAETDTDTDTDVDIDEDVIGYCIG